MNIYTGKDTSNVLIHAMRVSEATHKQLANNIANVDTPRYTPVEIDFRKALQASLEGRGGIALRTSRPRHLNPREKSLTFERLAYLSKNDYNKVDIDDQMLKLSENTGRYNMFSSLLVKRFEQARNMLQSLDR